MTFNCNSITIRLTFLDLHREDVIAITKSKLDRLGKAYDAKKGMTLKMSKTQLAYNMKIEGEFLLMLAGLIPLFPGTVLPAFGLGIIGTGNYGCSTTNRKWVCILRREVVCVTLKLIGVGRTMDQQAVKDLKLHSLLDQTRWTV